MKKRLLAVLLLLIGTLVLLYFFIPHHLSLSVYRKIGCTQAAAMRMVADKNKWSTWSLSKQNKSENRLSDTAIINCTPGYAGYNFTNITIQHKKDTFNSMLFIMPASALNDSCVLNWQCTVTTGNNIIQKVKRYWLAKSLKKNLEQISNEMAAFLENPEKIYGIKVLEVKVTDSLLMSCKKIFPAYPSTVEVYKIIEQLTNYCTARGASITGKPMLHVQQSNGLFEAMVALPVSKEINSTANFSFKRMLKEGNILYAEVKGGEAAVREALNELENYRLDHKKVSPAIPFESLITNRLLEPDSSRWLTAICYPVF